MVSARNRAHVLRNAIRRLAAAGASDAEIEAKIPGKHCRKRLRHAIFCVREELRQKEGRRGPESYKLVEIFAGQRFFEVKPGLVIGEASLEALGYAPPIERKEEEEG